MNWRSRLPTVLISLAITLISLFVSASASFAQEPAPEEQYNQILLKHPPPHLTSATWKIVEAEEKRSPSPVQATLLITVEKGVTKSVAVKQSTAAKGDLDGALADYNQAIQVNPKLGFAYAERGNLKRDRDDPDRALADYQVAIQIQPHRFTGYYDIGIVAETRGNLEAALQAINQAAERIQTGKPRDYIEFAMCLVRAQLGRTDEATNNLTAYLDHRQEPAGDPWVTSIANFLVGKLAENDFITSANATEPWKNEEHHCEAWYYAGMKRLLAGDKKTAADYFTRCLATKKSRFVEYILARAELKSL